MIKYPENWCDIGHEVSYIEISYAIENCLRSLNVSNLSLSGGIDSTLLLFFMHKVLKKPIHCYTISLNTTHPDYLYAKLATEFFNVEFHPYFLEKSASGNEIVRIFYERLTADGITNIIAGDGIDEFSCGYYSHLEDPSERNYVSWIRRLHAEQLVPLNENSGDVSVFLPYLSPEVVSLISQVPLYEKMDATHRKKTVIDMARGNIPEKIITRWKYGFCDASVIKGAK